MSCGKTPARSKSAARQSDRRIIRGPAGGYTPDLGGRTPAGPPARPGQSSSNATNATQCDTNRKLFWRNRAMLLTVSRCFGVVVFRWQGPHRAGFGRKPGTRRSGGPGQHRHRPLLPLDSGRLTYGQRRQVETVHCISKWNPSASLRARMPHRRSMEMLLRQWVVHNIMVVEETEP
jgi:hypothetical protein